MNGGRNLIEQNLNGISNGTHFSAAAFHSPSQFRIHLKSCYLKLSVYLLKKFHFVVVEEIFFAEIDVEFSPDSLLSAVFFTCESSYFFNAGLSANKLKTFAISLVGVAFEPLFYWRFVELITSWRHSSDIV